MDRDTEAPDQVLDTVFVDQPINSKLNAESILRNLKSLSNSARAHVYP